MRRLSVFSGKRGILFALALAAAGGCGQGMEQGGVDSDQTSPDANAKSTEQAIVSGSASAIMNSDPTLEQKFLPGIGYMNGITCDTWPRDVAWDGSGDMNPALRVLSRYSISSSVKVLKTMAERLRGLGIGGGTVFGSNNELTVISAKQTSTGGSLLVALDVPAGQGYVLDDQWLCSQSDLQNNPLACDQMEVTDAGNNSYQVLGRTVPRDVTGTPNTAILVAPQIHFNGGSSNAIVSNANLIAIGQRVYGGRDGYTAGEDLSARAATLSLTTVPTSMQQLTRPSREEWQAMIAQPRIPSVLSVMADEMGGFSEIVAHAPATVERIKVSNMFAQTRYSLASRILYLRPEEFFVVGTRETSVHLALAPDDRQYYSTNTPVVYTYPVSLPPVSRAPGGSGSTFVLSGHSNVSATVDAEAGAPMTVTYDEAALRGFISDIASPLLASRATYSVEFRTDSALPQWIAVFDGASWRVTPDYPTTSLNDLLFANSASTHGLVTRFDDLMPAGSPDFSPLARMDANTDTGVRQATMGAELFSGGAFADVLHGRSELDSLRTGEISPTWDDTYRLVDDYNLGVKRISDFDPALDMGLDTNKRTHVFNMEDALQINQNVSVPSNVLGLPYGARAGDFYSVRTRDNNAGPNSFYAAQSRWTQLTSLVNAFQAAADKTYQVRNSAQRAATIKLFDSLSSSLQDGLNDASAAASTVSNAANVNAGIQQQALTDLETGFDKVITLDQDLQKQIGALWGCDTTAGDAAACIQAAENKLNALQNACNPVNFAVFKLAMAIMDKYPPIAAAEAALKSINGGKGFADTAEQLLEMAGQPDDASRGPDIGNLAQVAQVAKDTGNADDYATVSSKLTDGLAKALEQSDSACPAGGQAKQNLDAFKAQVILVNNLNQNYVNQLHLIRTEMDAELGHVAYLTTSGGAYANLVSRNEANLAVLRKNTENISKAVKALNSGDYAQISKQQRTYLQNACQVANKASRAASADLYMISQAMQTATGRASTLPTIVVPANPAYHFSDGSSDGLLKVDRRFGFATSLWDDGAFQSRFEPSGSGSTTDYMTLASNRYSQLVSQELCDLPPKIGTRFLVRKVLTGQAFRSLVAGGKLDFNINLEDVVLGGNRNPNTKAAMALNSATNAFDLQLGGAFVISANYSVCKGAAGKECSVRVPLASLGNVATGKLNGLSLMNRGTAQIPVPRSARARACAESNWMTADSALKLEKDYTVSTCFTTVVAPQETLLLEYNDVATAPDEQILIKSVRDKICSATPEVLVAQPLQGLPLMGTWALARADVASTVSNSMAAAPISVTAPAVSGATGIEVLFMVGTEPLETSEQPAYKLQ